MITIAVDAMGGDHAPQPEVEGSVLAAQEYGVRVVLVGQPEVIRAELARYSRPSVAIEIKPATEVITMDDHPAQAFRRKKDSSVHVGARLVKDGQADAFVSAGNTGAVMTAAKFIMGTLPSVDRVALAAPFPNARGTASVLLDVGANVDSKPELRTFSGLVKSSATAPAFRSMRTTPRSSRPRTTASLRSSSCSLR
jgi:phosphate acyltransferase